MAAPLYMAAAPDVMNAIAGPSPASGRSVAIRRPGWTAARGRPSSAPSAAAVRSMSSTRKARPQRRAGPSGSRATLEPSGACTTSRIGSPARKKAWRVEPPGVGPSRRRRRSKPCDSSSCTVLSSFGDSITTWSTRSAPFGCGPAASPDAASPSVQPTMPRRGPFPTSRSRTRATRHSRCATSKPAALHAAGSSAISSSSMLGTRGTLPAWLLRRVDSPSRGLRRCVRNRHRRAGVLDIRLRSGLLLRRRPLLRRPGLSKRLRRSGPRVRAARGGLPAILAALDLLDARVALFASQPTPAYGVRVIRLLGPLRAGVGAAPRALGAPLRSAQSVAPLGADPVAVRTAGLDRRMSRRGPDRLPARRVARGGHLRGVLLRDLLDGDLAGDDAPAGNHAHERDLGQGGRAEREPARRCAAHGAAGEAGGPHDARLQAEGGRDRERHRQQLTLATHLLAVRAASRAAAQVVAKLVAAKRSAAERRELLADLAARRLARGAALDQGAARAEREPLHAAHLAAEDLGDFGVPESSRLGEQQRGALLLGQLADIGQQLAQLRAALHVLAEAGRRQLVELRRMLTARAQHRYAAIARDRVQPRLERDIALITALKVLVCRGEGVLHRVLRLLAESDHVAAEREDSGAVPLEDHLERALVPAPYLLDEPLIARDGKQPLRGHEAAPASGLAVSACGEGSGFHGLLHVPARIAHSNALGIDRFACNPQTSGFYRRFTTP